MAQRLTTQLSARGQLLLPKIMRDRLGWRAGHKLVVEEGPEGVFIREATAQATSPKDDAIADIDEVFGCLGPAKRPVSIEAMNSAPGDYARRRWGREYDDFD